MGMTLTAAPAVEPISLAELKLQARIDYSDEDALLALIIAAARAKCESYTGRSLITQTWAQMLDEFPAFEIELLRPPVTAINSVTYIDTAGATQTLSSPLYTLDAATHPGWLLPAYATDWPDTRDQANAVTITYVCGYASAAAIPADLRAWLLLTAAFLYAQRETMVLDGKVAEIPGRFIDSLLDPYRVFRM
jgi:uncharacterized phiE125 gp8 family phage protein